MLFWEAVFPQRRRRPSIRPLEPTALRSVRLPYDKRCAGVTKVGRRCRGRIVEGSDYCTFHDPDISAQRRRENASKGGRSHRRLSHIPDGYLRRLTDRASIGHAMDRLYREVRLGIVTSEMGAVLFGILCRLLDSGMSNEQRDTSVASRRGKADRIRPKLAELLTHTERAAWRQAATNAPEVFFRMTPQERAQAALNAEGDARRGALAEPGLGAAS